MNIYSIVVIIVAVLISVVGGIVLPFLFGTDRMSQTSLDAGRLIAAIIGVQLVVAGLLVTAIEIAADHFFLHRYVSRISGSTSAPLAAPSFMSATPSVIDPLDSFATPPFSPPLSSGPLRRDRMGTLNSYTQLQMEFLRLQV